jgi:DNA gyrase subunit A
MGVKFVGVGDNDSVVVIALNPETTAEAAELAGSDTADSATSQANADSGDQPAEAEVREDDSD